MSEYIALLWPSREDAEHIEVYRQEICRGCDVAASLTWPAHLSLFYGIQTDMPERLADAVREVASGTPAFRLKVQGLGTYDNSVVLLRIAPCDEVLLLQKRISDVVHRTGAHLPGYPAPQKPDGTPLTSEEKANIAQWGSYFPYQPHITLARHLSAEQCERVAESARKLTSLVPQNILMNRLSIETLGSLNYTEAGASETLVTLDLAPRAPTS